MPIPAKSFLPRFNSVRCIHILSQDCIWCFTFPRSRCWNDTIYFRPNNDTTICSIYDIEPRHCQKFDEVLWLTLAFGRVDNCHALPYLHQLSRCTLLTSIVTHYFTYINCHALPYLHQLSRTTLLTSIVTHYLTYFNCHALPYLHQLSRTTLLTSIVTHYLTYIKWLWRMTNWTITFHSMFCLLESLRTIFFRLKPNFTER